MKSGGLDIDVDRTFDDYAYPIEGNEDATCGLTDQQIASDSAAIASGSATELDSFPCRYKHIHFDKGSMHMDGETAPSTRPLASRIGSGDLILPDQKDRKKLSALLRQNCSLWNQINPVKVIDLINTLSGSLETDIQQGQYADFIRMAQDMKGAKISSTVLDTGDSESGRYGLLINPPAADYGGGRCLHQELARQIIRKYRRMLRVK